ncbi:hypothetical protein Pen02_79640 [Plantactinospora endophytica]|uniref:Secreted protein n=1 Tax=Plantactinospora endophytica TaxID=673535 RepID=A0ABQ4EE63_9ACTN|nr:hypothetical protein Pen02_79640 [Plantactinospora endophytica]
MVLRRTLLVLTVALGLFVPWTTTASAAPAKPASAAAENACNGYQPYAYPPGRNGDVISGIGGCGSQVVNVEIWIDVAGPFDVRAGCCPRGYSPVTAYAYCSSTGAGNYYTLARTPMGNIESERRWLC